MRRLAVVLLLATPHLTAAQQGQPFTPGRFDHILEGSSLRIAVAGDYGGNSLDLLGITSAARIINDFNPSDILLIGGLFPGNSQVRFGSRANAALSMTITAGAWYFSASAGAGSYAGAQVPETAALLLRAGNTVNSTVDTRNLFVRALGTREVGIGVTRRLHAGTTGITLGAHVRHVTPWFFASGAMHSLQDGPALTVQEERISAQTDLTFTEGAVEGRGYAFDLFGEIEHGALRASVHLSDAGAVVVDALVQHRAIVVRSVDLVEFAEAIDRSTPTQSRESRAYTLPQQLEARLSRSIGSIFAAGLFVRRRSMGELGIAEFAAGAALGWSPADALTLRTGMTWNDSKQWKLSGGGNLGVGRLSLDASIETDGFQNVDHARGLMIATSLAVLF